MSKMDAAKPVILSDIDGVVADVVTLTLDTLVSDFGIVCSPEHITEYDMARSLWGHVSGVFSSEKAFADWMRRRVWSNSAMMMLAPMYWDIGVLYRALILAGVDIRYFTARPERLSKTTDAWLEMLGLEPQSRFCVAHRTDAKSKVEAYTSLARTLLGRGHRVYIIEDYTSIADDVFRTMKTGDFPSGWTVLVPDRPWTCRSAVMQRLRCDVVLGNLLRAIQGVDAESGSAGSE